MFKKHYIRPLLLRRRKRAYDARRYFESWHRSTLGAELSDRVTLSRDFDLLFARYHYNAVQNAILEHLAGHRPPAAPSVLDVGSGAGHWIDFFRQVFGARRAVGLEISAPCAEALRRKYAGDGTVAILRADVSEPGLELGERFEIASAIGVLFHVVDDAAWERAVGNLARHLAPGGRLVVGGHFGWITQDVQFHARDDFERWEEREAKGAEVALVDKRIRSLRRWKRCARAAGLEVEGLVRTRRPRGIRMPENNVLVLRRAP